MSAPVVDPRAAVIARARQATAPAPMPCRVIAVDGLGGAGKTTLAAAVAAGLGAQIVATDDFASWEHPTDWWPRVLEQVLEPLSRGEPGRYQRYDWDAARLAEWHDVPIAEFLVLEGVSASREAFGPYLALRVWVQTPRAERLRRGLERDGADALELWRGWMAAEDAYVEAERPRERADLVVSGLPVGG